MEQHDQLILGAGPCGLAVAWELMELGRPRSLLVEREQQPGGLARSFDHGRYRLDLSIHRLQVQDPGLLARLEGIFAGRLRRVPLKSIHIQLDGRRVPYPLGPGSLLRLPGRRMLEAGLQYLRAPRQGAAENYRQWFEAHFGAGLYDWIVGPLMSKQWGLSPDNLSPALAAHRRLSLGPRDLLAGLPLVGRLLSREIPISFLYGRQGSGELMAHLADGISGGGGQLMLGQRPVALRHRRARVEQLELASGETLETPRLVSTIPLPTLVELFDPPAPAPLRALARELRFRALVVVGLALDRRRVSRDHVTYFPEGRYPFSRTFEPKNASPAVVPRGTTVLGFELPCFAGDPTWRLPDEELGRWMASFGPELGFSEREVQDAFVVRVPEAYPLYETGHERRAGRILRWLHGELRNLFVVGRNGLFRLDNMDHAFTMGFDLARHLDRGGTPLAWHRGLDRYRGLSYID